MVILCDSSHIYCIYGTVVITMIISPLEMLQKVTEVILGATVIFHPEQKSDWPDTRPVAVEWKWFACSPFSPRHMMENTVIDCECRSAAHWRREQIFQLWNACDNEDSGRTEVDRISHCVPVIMATFHRFRCSEWQALFGRECMLSVSGSAGGTEPLLRTGGWRLRRESGYTRLPRVTAQRNGFGSTNHHNSAACNLIPCLHLHFMV